MNDRINDLRNLIYERNIDYYIIPTADPHGSEYIDAYYESRRFMTGFTGSAGTLVVSKDEAALFVDGRYHIQADKEVSGSDISVYKIGEKDVPTVIEYLKEKADHGEITIGFDGRCYDEFTFEKMQKTLNDAKFSIEEDLVDIIWNSDRPKRTANRVYTLDDDVISTQCDEKLSVIRDYLNEKSLDAVFISELSDIMWLFNVRGSDIECNPVAYSYALITKDVAILFLQKGSFDKNMEETLKPFGVILADYDEIELELAKLKGKKICLDKTSTNCLNVKILSCGNDIKHVRNHILVKKYIKDKAEIDLARKYHVVDAVSMIKFIVWIKKAVISEKITEYEAAIYLDNLRRENKGFMDLSFDTISAYAENAAIVHYSPSESDSKMLEAKGLLLVDSGAQYMGATTDITRTISLGTLLDEEKRAYTLVLKGNLRLMNAVFLKGCRGENLDILAREALWKEGFDYMHGTGHGIGAFLNVHEGPCSIRYRIMKDNIQPPLEAGVIISDEPGYYKSGAFGIRHETQLLCVDKFSNEYGDFLGFEPLSLVPFEKEAIVKELLTEEEIAILNEYHALCFMKLRTILGGEEYLWLEEACKLL